MSVPVDTVMVLRPLVSSSSAPAPSPAVWHSDSSGDGRPAADPPAAKKRRRSPSSALPPSAPPASASRPRSASGAPLSATHELRLLRSQVASMEEQLRGLTSAWEAQLPDPRTLQAAQVAAAEKRASQRTDGAHLALEDALAQQQLAFAALQSLVLAAPLHSHGREMFAALHLGTVLSADAADRERQLRAHFDRAVDEIPPAVGRFSRLELAGKPSLVPQSKVSVTGGADHTLVSSVFVSAIPSRSLPRVFEAARGYFNGLPSAVKRHLGTDMDREDLLDADLALGGDDYVQYRRTTITSAALRATANTVVCAALREDRAVFHVDVVLDDARHPLNAAETPRFAIAGLTLEPSEDDTAVTLRLAIVYRYERLPQDPVVAHELREHRAILNGDLLMASLCQHLREQPR